MNGRSHLAVNFAAAVILSSVAARVHAFHFSGDAHTLRQLLVPGHMRMAAFTSPFALQKAVLYLSMFLGAWLPDLDQERSSISRRFPWISAIIRRFFSHRTFTHSLLGVMTSVLFFSCIGLIINMLLATRGVMIPPALQQGYLIGLISVAFGCLCHMAADTLTPMGIPWFWPVPFRYKIPIIRGQFQEFVFVGTLLFLVGVAIGFHVLTF